MNLLLDTHSFLWFIGGNARLSEPARSWIESEANQSFVSIASLWEIAIKASLGKLSLAQPFEELIPGQLEKNGFILLEIRVQHLSALLTLPFHHRDPFDRLLISQAQVEEMAIVSADDRFDAYITKRVW